MTTRIKKEGEKSTENKEEELANAHFVQLDKSVMKEWRMLIGRNPIAVEIMYFFMEKMGYDNAIVCSYKVLEEITGTSRSSVARAIKSLKDGKWIQPVKIGSALAYVVNEKVAWQTYANRRQYAIFRATVIAAGSEQKEIELQNSTEDTKKLMRIPVVINKAERPVIRDENLPPPDQNELELN